MLAWLVGVVGALLVASLAEYRGHRLMHAGFKRAKHAQHHKSGAGGLLREVFGFGSRGFLL